MPRTSMVDMPEQPAAKTKGAAPSADRSPPLSRAMSVAGWGLSSGDDRTISAAIDTLKRTGVTHTGLSYGFALAWDQSKDVWYKSRMMDGPFARVRWLPTKFQSWKQPIYNESSRANGSRWGGLNGNVGLSETYNLTNAASGPVLAKLNFSICRLTVFTPPMSRDLVADAAMVTPMLDYVSRSEIRFLVDQALVWGNSTNTNTGQVTAVAPRGVMTSPSTIGVKRAMAGTISAADIDTAWASIAGPNKVNAAWFASDETISTLDQISNASGWPETIYISAGRYGNTYPLIKGRPLIYLENCAPLGHPCDLFVADFSDYVMYYQVYEPSESSLSFTLAPPDLPTQGRGAWGLPDRAIEARKSDQLLFLSDEVVFMFKARMDGAWLWSGPTKNVNGAIVGPAAYVD